MGEVTLPGFKFYYSSLDIKIVLDIKIEPCTVVQTLHLELRKLMHDEPEFEIRRGYTDLISKPNKSYKDVQYVNRRNTNTVNKVQKQNRESENHAHIYS